MFTPSTCKNIALTCAVLQLHVSDAKTACTADGKPNLSLDAFRKIFITSTAGRACIPIGHGSCSWPASQYMAVLWLGHCLGVYTRFLGTLLSSFAELPGMLLAAVVVEMFSRKRTLAAGLLITGVCTAALVASPAQVRTHASRVASFDEVVAMLHPTGYGCLQQVVLCCAGIPVGQQGWRHGRLCSFVHLHARGASCCTSASLW